jgi:membrane peptidoglycan carboxypeptidase
MSLTRNQLKHTRRNAASKRKRYLRRRGVILRTHYHAKWLEEIKATAARAKDIKLRGIRAKLESPKTISQRKGFFARIFRRGNA